MAGVSHNMRNSIKGVIALGRLRITGLGYEMRLKFRIQDKDPHWVAGTEAIPRNGPMAATHWDACPREDS